MYAFQPMKSGTIVALLVVSLCACRTSTVIEDVEALCEGIDCSGHGTCAVQGGDTVVCICDMGYRADGQSCVEVVSGAECDGVTCDDHGTCVVVNGDPDYPLCQCDAGYEEIGGTTCIEVVDPCAGETCSGHGDCAVQGGDTAVCICDDGYVTAHDTSCVLEGTCVPATCESLGVTCGTHSDGCEDTLDCGECLACECEQWITSSASLDLPNTDTGLGARGYDAAFNGDDIVAIIYQLTADPGVLPEVFLELKYLDGTNVAPGRQLAAHGRSGAVDFGGGRFVATWSTYPNDDMSSEPTIHALAIAPDDTILAGPQAVVGPDAWLAGVGTLGEETYVLYHGPDNVRAVELDSSLSPVGDEIDLPGIGGSTFGIEVSGLGDAIAVIGSGSPGTTIRWALLRDGTVMGPIEVGIVSSSENRPWFAHAATNGSDAMVCFQADLSSISCRRASPVNGQFSTPAFVVVPDDTSRAWGVVAAGCAYQIPVGRQVLSGSNSIWSAVEIDQSDSITIRRIGALYGQPTQTAFLFETSAGALLRLTGGQITTSVCGPVIDDPSCEDLTNDVCDFACGGACEPPTETECRWAFPGSVSAFPRDGCLVACSSIDRAACQIALDGPQTCTPDGIWVIPPDCKLY